MATSTRPPSPSAVRAIFREINERISELSDGRRELVLVCECDDCECTTALVVSVGVYESTRARWGQFVACEDHLDRFERVVAQKDGYAVVEARA